MVLRVLFNTMFLLWCGIACAQDLNYSHYTVDDGLPSAQVHDIVQDTYGNLWFSTDQGLSRYNGYEFKNYTTNDGLPDNLIFKFQKNRNGEIWASTLSKKLFSITGAEPKFKLYKYNHALTPLPEAFVTISYHVTENESVYMSFLNAHGYIYVDEKGRVVHNSVAASSLVLQSGMAIANDGHCFTYIKKAEERKIAGNWKHVISSLPRLICSDYTKGCYFESSGHAVFTNPREVIIQSATNKNILIPVSFEPISIGKLDGTHFWVGFRYGGIGIFDLNGNRIQTFLSNKSVTSLCIDHEGGYWFSTVNDGVYHAKDIRVLGFPLNTVGDNWVCALEKDSLDHLVVGAYNGNVYKIRNKKPICLYEPTIKKPALVTSNTHKSFVYFSSDFYFFNSYEKKSLLCFGLNPTCIYVHNKDTLVTGTYKGISIYRHKQPDIEINYETGFRVNDVCSYKNLFYLATNKGLYWLKPGGKKISHYFRLFAGKKMPTQKTSFITKPAFSTLVANSVAINKIEIKKDIIALATKGSGILLIQHNSLIRIDEKKGLSNNFVINLFWENQHCLWACTNSGLNRIKLNKGKLRSIEIFSTQNGLPGNEVTDIEIIHDTVWVGTRQGLCYFPLPILNEKKPEINYYLSISSFKINDYNRPLTNGCELSYNENRLEFGFSGKSFHESVPLVYRYKLDGLESKWNYSTSLTTVYSSLPPGTYTFILQAKGKNNSWKKGGQTFSFTIFPPFWKTWWFFIAVSITIALLIYLFFKFRILSYNRDITRELMRQILKRFNRKSAYVVFREQGKDIRILSSSIFYVMSEGNYIEIHTDSKKYVIRHKLGEFLNIVPDPLEYLRISRSCIVRIDRVQEKTKKTVTVKGVEIAVGETYIEQLQKIKFKV
ncbi:MAG TPA: two-component regulator propeller domain-containing protein [Flavobacteriales bacterium]|nr:two-component regulator propeller domain-containing protein [Flavobacteriales bacterium]